MQHLCDNDEEFLPEDYEKTYGKDPFKEMSSEDIDKA